MSTLTPRQPTRFFAAVRRPIPTSDSSHPPRPPSPDPSHEASDRHGVEDPLAASEYRGSSELASASVFAGYWEPQQDSEPVDDNVVDVPAGVHDVWRARSLRIGRISATAQQASSGRSSVSACRRRRLRFCGLPGGLFVAPGAMIACMSESDQLASIRTRLPRHAALLDSMCSVVAEDERWRFLEVGCSLGAGGGDELSDIDAGLGYAEIEAGDLYAAAREFAWQLDPIDLVVHRMDGWPDDVCRVAAEYAGGLQLDLVFMPAANRHGLPDRSIAVIDKDDRLAEAITPPSRLPPSIEVMREWVVLGWWAIATADKYVRRSSLFEAVHAINEARTQALRLWAAGHGVPYALYGLTSLLDFPPFEIPDGLAATYAVPDDEDAVASANRATADLLDAAAALATAALGPDVASPLSPVVRDRLT